MSAACPLDGVDTAHTQMIEMVHRLKTVGFIVIEEQSSAVGDGPQVVVVVLIHRRCLVDGVVAASRSILVGGEPIRQSDDALTFCGYP